MQATPTLPFNPGMTGIAAYLPDIPFATHGERTLCLQLLKPAWACGEARCPLVVFVQGSSWTIPNAHYQIPQLSAFAQAGFAVASVTHRSRAEAPFPAFLEDVKTAIRFLRAHAEEYGIDPDRVGIWGTSSGGNAALLAGLTAGEYHTDEYPDMSSRVQAVVACFAPTDIPDMINRHYPDAWHVDVPENIFHLLSGRPMAQSRPILEAMSPLYRIRPGMELPPFLLMHGDADDVVDYDQSERCCKALLRHGYRAQLYRVPGAPHEYGFWSQPLLAVIMRFLDETLKA